MTRITLPDSVTSIGYAAFDGCTGLTSITLPFVGADNNSFDHIFGYLVPESLATVVITGETNIESFAFSGCTGLTDVYYTGTEEQWAVIEVGYGNHVLTEATVHCNWSGAES